MFLGIEIGGTKLQLGVGPGDGTIVALERAKVDAAAGAERIRQQIIELVPALLSRAGLSRADIRAVGFGFGGPVDAETGIVTKSHQIEGWAGFPLADWSRRELGWPTVVHNDADTAGLAEACFGAGRGYNPIFYITIGSGIGGGLIIDKKIYRGAGAGAAEIGHITLPEPLAYLDDPEGFNPIESLFRTGNRQIETTDPNDVGVAVFAHVHSIVGSPQPITVESYCCGWAIARRVREMATAPESWYPEHRADARSLVDSVGGNVGQLTVEVVARASQNGNRLAQRTLNSAWRVLGWAIAQMITLLCPRRVIIGGGVSLIGEDLLFAPLRDEVARYVFAPFADSFDIVPAELVESVVVHGALRLAHDTALEASKQR